MVAPVVAPYVPTYATYTPYISAAEFLAEPTGVDTTQLVPAGSSADNLAALTRVIARASADADTICRQILAATTDIQAGAYRVFADGTIRVPLDYTPLIMVTGVSLGYAAGSLAAMTDLSGIWPGRKVVRIPVYGNGVTALQVAPPPRAPSGYLELFAQVTYVNGYAHTSMGSSSLAGATSITPKSVLGIVPGLPMTWYDGASTESAAVDASYVVGAATVPLASPLTYAHAAGVTVSALPPVVRDAVILLTAHRIKTRGAESVSMGAISSEPGAPQPALPGATSEYNEAVELLKPLRRVR